MAILNDTFEFSEAYEYLINSPYTKFINIEKKIQEFNRIRDDRLNNKIINKYLIVSLLDDVFGLPEMIISGKVFLSGCIMGPFRLLGMAKISVPTGDVRLDPNFECLVKRKNKAHAQEELELMMKTKFPEWLSKIEKNYSSISYYFGPLGNHLQINFTSDLKMEKKELNCLVEALMSIKDILKVSNPEKHEFSRIMNIWNMLNADICKKVKYENNEWKYPREWNIFISKISRNIWMDENYTQKPVMKWIEEHRSPESMNMEERKSYFTYIVRQERFCEGFWKTFMEKYFTNTEI
jgi:hypothetical protein